jgi:hypothetical protein
LVEADQQELWRDEGARDMAHWVQMHLGISWWKADRWVQAAHAVRSLPKTAEALSSGRLSIDKVVELARFATPESEARLISWAERVSATAIRHRADVEAKAVPEEAEAAEAGRFVEWWLLEGGTRLRLRAELPATDGAQVIEAIERRAAKGPVRPEEEEAHLYAAARRADALVALCTEGRAVPAGPSGQPPLWSTSGPRPWPRVRPTGSSRGAGWSTPGP